MSSGSNDETTASISETRIASMHFIAKANALSCKQMIIRYSCTVYILRYTTLIVINKKKYNRDNHASSLHYYENTILYSSERNYIIIIP